MARTAGGCGAGSNNWLLPRRRRSSGQKPQILPQITVRAVAQSLHPALQFVALHPTVCAAIKFIPNAHEECFKLFFFRQRSWRLAAQKGFQCFEWHGPPM